MVAMSMTPTTRMVPTPNEERRETVFGFQNSSWHWVRDHHEKAISSHMHGGWWFALLVLHLGVLVDDGCLRVYLYAVHILGTHTISPTQSRCRSCYVHCCTWLGPFRGQLNSTLNSHFAYIKASIRASGPDRPGPDGAKSSAPEVEWCVRRKCVQHCAWLGRSVVIQQARRMHHICVRPSFVRSCVPALQGLRTSSRGLHLLQWSPPTTTAPLTGLKRRMVGLVRIRNSHSSHLPSPSMVPRVSQGFPGQKLGLWCGHGRRAEK